MTGLTQEQRKNAFLFKLNEKNFRWQKPFYKKIIEDIKNERLNDIFIKSLKNLAVLNTH